MEGQLAVVHQPPKINIIRKTIGQVLMYTLVPILAPVFISFKYISDKTFRSTFVPYSKSLYSLVSASTLQPISKEWYYQDTSLLKQLWTLSSAQVYIDNVEYQIKEGYCGSATMLCILRSFGLSSDMLPPQKRGETKPEKWCTHITQIAKEIDEKMNLETTIIKGDVSYDEFVTQLKDGLANDNVRIACNFLRSALMGFEKARYIPTHLILSLLGGHFSPILGIVEHISNDEQQSKVEYLAIFDTNHKYGGVYFVPVKRLYESVKTVDLGSNKHRAIILVEKK